MYSYNLRLRAYEGDSSSSVECVPLHPGLWLAVPLHFFFPWRGLIWEVRGVEKKKTRISACWSNRPLVCRSFVCMAVDYMANPTASDIEDRRLCRLKIGQVRRFEGSLVGHFAARLPGILAWVHKNETFAPSNGHKERPFWRTR